MFNSTWYQNLIQPSFAPPDWVFQPVWNVLYLMITFALILYILSNNDNKKVGYILFAIQTILNILWPLVFFGLKSILGGLFVIILLDVFVFLTIKKFYFVRKISAFLLIPYFCWVLFATCLNFAYLFLNK